MAHHHHLLNIIIIIIIEGLSEHTSDHGKQTQAQKKRGSMARTLLGANAKSYRLQLQLKLSRLVSTSADCPPASTGWQPLLKIITNSNLSQLLNTAPKCIS